MITSSQNLARIHTVKKLNQLFTALQGVKKKYEALASSIKDKQLYHAIISLAVENNQYATELSSLIQSLGGEPEPLNSQLSAESENQKPRSEKNILNACEKSERLLVKMYRDVLQERYVYDSLKKMIGNQLNGINFSFHRLKLLNTFHK
jgi:uncharacterized protein (TIGR02284 family)